MNNLINPFDEFGVLWKVLSLHQSVCSLVVQKQSHWLSTITF